MTEQEWIEGDELRPMLEFIRPRTSERKLRLFACACASQLRHLLFDLRSVLALETAERCADGLASETELRGAEKAAFEIARTADLRTTATDPRWAATRAAARAAALDPFAAAMGAAFVATLGHAPWVFHPGGGVEHHGAEPARSQAHCLQCDNLREVVGNPFRSPWVEGEWLRWNDEIVARLALEIYQTSRFADLPVLADALEDAGCDCADLLDHLRRPAGHVRGCWAVDFLLGR